jgi:hypothetical protein
MEETMKRLSFLFALILLVTACGPAPAGKDVIAGCSETVAAVRALWADYPLPDYMNTENPVERGGEFDPNAYFTVLDGLSMEPGYTLDFVYSYDWMGSYPTLLARPETSAPYLSWDDVPGPGGDYLASVQANGTAESYFQFVVMTIMARHFYLVWHANYNDLQIVCDRAAVRGILAGISGGDIGLPMPFLDRMRALSLGGLEPTVDIGEQTVEVRVVTFSRWAGFYEDTFTLSRDFPHTLQGIQHKLLVPYDCGILF